MSGSNDCVPLYFAVPVWGDSYVDVFVQTALAAQLAPNNLPALPHLQYCRYNIYTTHRDAARLRAQPIFTRLATLVETEIHFIDSSMDGIGDLLSRFNRYEVKSECYRHSMREAVDANAANVLLNADIVLCDNFLLHAVELLKSGKRVIEVVGPRAFRAPVEAILHERFRAGDGLAITISAQELAAIWVEHIHTMSRIHFWEGDTAAPFHPSHLYWRAGRRSVLARCFHIYPIVFLPNASNADFRVTIDDDLVARARLKRRESYVAVDSNELFCLELSPADHWVGTPGKRGDIASTANFYLRYGLARNFKLLRYRIRIEGGDEDPVAWKRAIRKSNWVIFLIYCNVLSRLPLRLLFYYLRRVAPAVRRVRRWMAGGAGSRS